MGAGQLLEHSPKEIPLIVEAGWLGPLGGQFEIEARLLEDGPDEVQHAMIQRREKMMEDVVAVHGQFRQQDAFHISAIANGVQLA